MITGDLRIPGKDAEFRRLVERIDLLRRELSELSASVGRFGATYSESGVVVTGGSGLTINDGGKLKIGAGGAIDMDGTGGAPLLHVGDVKDPVTGAVTGRGLQMWKPNGKPTVLFEDTGASIMDGGGNVVLGTDRPTGYGLASPRATWTMAKFDEKVVVVPSGTLPVSWHTQGVLSHPYINFSINLKMEVASSVGKVIIDITEPTGTNKFSYTWTSAPVSATGAITHIVPVFAQPNAAPHKYVNCSVTLVADAGSVSCTRPYVQLAGAGAF